MPILKNFVAVDWRAGKDRLYFFFKDSNTYTRFDIDDNRVPDGYPGKVDFDNWHDFHTHAKDLRFGFNTLNFQLENNLSYDQDVLWLFYYSEGKAGDYVYLDETTNVEWDPYVSDDIGVPMICKYSQDTDKVISAYPAHSSIWRKIVPYFDHIIAGTRWGDGSFRFLLNNGNSLRLTFNYGEPSSKNSNLTVEPITNKTWPGLEPYKNRIITAVQNHRTLADSYYYIFLTNNEYITYNIDENKVEYGPYTVSEQTWPGLLRD